jgi:predicted dehydrogenase
MRERLKLINKVKIYGAGSIGNHLAHACRNKGWDVTVCDRDDDALTRMKNDIYPSRYGKWDESIKLSRDASGMQTKYFDVVIIGTPPESHVPLALKELKYFNPEVIMIEKPLSTPDMEGCQELFELSEQKGVFVTCSYNHTLTPNTNMASELISNGLIKNGKSIHVRWLEHWGGIFDAHPWLDGPQDSYLGFSDRGGGACGEHSHGISIWQHFSHLLNQGKISEVTSTMKIVNDTYDETTQILVKSENGIIGTIIQDVVTDPSVKKARIQGEDGYLEWIVNYSDSEDALICTSYYPSGEGAFRGRFPKCIPFFKSRPDDFKWEIEHIEDILDNKTDRDSSPISLERGLDVMLVIAAAHLSNETGKKVKIDYKKGYSLEALNVI